MLVYSTYLNISKWRFRAPILGLKSRNTTSNGAAALGSTAKYPSRSQNALKDLGPMPPLEE